MQKGKMINPSKGGKVSDSATGQPSTQPTATSTSTSQQGQQQSIGVSSSQPTQSKSTTTQPVSTSSKATTQPTTTTSSTATSTGKTATTTAASTSKDAQKNATNSAGKPLATAGTKPQSPQATAKKSSPRGRQKSSAVSTNGKSALAETQKSSPAESKADVEKGQTKDGKGVAAVAPERDFFGVRKSPGRVYLYVGAVALALLLIAIIATIAVVASSPDSDTAPVGVRVNNRTGAPTISPVPAPSPSELFSDAPTSAPVSTGSGTAPPTTAQTNETSSPTVSPLSARLEGSKPNIMFVMMDDLGYHDVGYVPDKPRAKVVQATARMTKLAKEEGVILTRMYAHWHCSPSRRSFLTGRLPHRTGEDNSDTDMDDIDLRWTWVSEKLQSAGYKCYMLGKGHTGYKSYQHLPTQNGFDRFVGLLVGKAGYNKFKLWKDGKPDYDNEITGIYSTKFYREEAVKMLDTHRRTTPSQPFFMFLSLQTPHTPIEPPSSSDRDYSGFTTRDPHPYERMLYAADVELQRLVDYLKRNNMWANTLFIFSSDNGATTKDVPQDGSGKLTRGNNYPLRGDKSTNFEGGLRATAFVSGGFLPAAQRGTVNPVVSHIADWYATFSFLAGVDASDNPPEQPLEVDASVDVLNPFKVVNGRRRSLWGDNSFPAPDSKNLLPHLVEPEKHDPNGLRPEGLVLDFETIILGDYKLITAQPCPLEKGENSCKRDKLFGWLREDAKNFDPVNDENLGCLYRFKQFAKNARQLSPCLFNLRTDMREKRPITTEPAKLRELWLALNNSIAYQYNTHLVGKGNGLSPQSMLGNCVSRDRAGKRWLKERLKAVDLLCSVVVFVS